MREFIGIQRWMVEELNLTGNELLVYAIIFGFSQDGESRFCGTLKYITDWTGCTKKTAIRILSDLVERGYIEKREEGRNGIKINSYAVVTLEGSELHHRGQNYTTGDILSPSSPLYSPSSPFPPETPLSTTTPIIPTTPGDIPPCGDINITSSPQGESVVELAQKVYDVYPSRDVPTANYPKGRSLSKCSKDKDTIVKLLREGKYTADHLIAVIRQEIAEHPNGYMKNFATFLNHIPELEAVETPKTDRETERAIWIAHGSKAEEMPHWMKKERGLV